MLLTRIFFCNSPFTMQGNLRKTLHWFEKCTDLLFNNINHQKSSSNEITIKQTLILTLREHYSVWLWIVQIFSIVMIETFALTFHAANRLFFQHSSLAHDVSLSDNCYFWFDEVFHHSRDGAPSRVETHWYWKIPVLLQQLCWTRVHPASSNWL